MPVSGQTGSRVHALNLQTIHLDRYRQTLTFILNTRCVENYVKHLIKHDASNPHESPFHKHEETKQLGASISTRVPDAQRSAEGSGLSDPELPPPSWGTGRGVGG